LYFKCSGCALERGRKIMGKKGGSTSQGRGRAVMAHLPLERYACCAVPRMLCDIQGRACCCLNLSLASARVVGFANTGHVQVLITVAKPSHSSASYLTV
jgi:hypothetical protein